MRPGGDHDGVTGDERVVLAAERIGEFGDGDAGELGVLRVDGLELFGGGGLDPFAHRAQVAGFVRDEFESKAGGVDDRECHSAPSDIECHGAHSFDLDGSVEVVGEGGLIDEADIAVEACGKNPSARNGTPDQMKL